MLSEQVPETSTGDPDEDLVTDILEKRKQSETHLAEWRKDAKNWYGLVSGGEEQWFEGDRAVMKDNEKPLVSFNRVSAMVRAIRGMEANNRKEAQYIPRQIEKAGENELLTHAAKWARDLCDAEDEDSDAFGDTIICGYGWTETKMDYEANPEGMIVVSRRDPGCFHYDPRAIKRNLSDKKWVQCDDYLDEDTIRSRWPDADLEGVGLEGRDQDSEPHDATQAPFYLKTAKQEVDDKSRLVIHHCWQETVVYWVVQNPPQFAPPQMDPQTGMVMPPQQLPPTTSELSDEEYKTALERGVQAGIPIQGKRKTKLVYKHVYVLGKQLLEDEPPEGGFRFQAPCQYEFIYNCITGYRDRTRGTFYGLVKDGEDPQRYANKMLSQRLHMINTNAKGGLVVETGAVSDVRQFEDNWAKTDGIVWVNAGAISQGKIMPKPLPQEPAAIDQLLQFSVQSINDVFGVNLEMMGLANRNQAGVLEEQRTAAGMTVVATLFDSLRQYRKQHARLLGHFIIEYISDGRLIRISGPLGQEYAPLIRQRGIMEYDVVVDDAPTSRDMKQKTFEALMKIAPMVMEQGGPVPEEALDYAPIPSQLAESWKQQIAAKRKEPPPPTPQEKVAQINTQAHLQEVDMKLKADTQTKQMEMGAKAQSEQMKGYFQEMKIHMDAQLEQMKAGLSAQLQQQEHRDEMMMRQIEMITQMNNTAQERQMNHNGAMQ